MYAWTRPGCGVSELGFRWEQERWDRDAVIEAREGLCGKGQRSAEGLDDERNAKIIASVISGVQWRTVYERGQLRSVGRVVLRSFFLIPEPIQDGMKV